MLKSLIIGPGDEAPEVSAEASDDTILDLFQDRVFERSDLRAWAYNQLNQDHIELSGFDRALIEKLKHILLSARRDANESMNDGGGAA